MANTPLTYQVVTQEEELQLTRQRLHDLELAHYQQSLNVASTPNEDAKAAMQAQLDVMTAQVETLQSMYSDLNKSVEKEKS